jgi:beta-galactosidase
MGITFALHKSFQQSTDFGRGPQDNYPDRHASTTIGLWKSTVSDQYVHYPHPQYSGNHDETVYLQLTDKKGHGWTFSCEGVPFSFTAIPYSQQHLVETAHDCDLTEDPDYIYLHIDAAVMGLGNSSCGPGVLKKYAIEPKEKELRLRITRK